MDEPTQTDLGRLKAFLDGTRFSYTVNSVLVDNSDPDDLTLRTRIRVVVADMLIFEFAVDESLLFLVEEARLWKG